MLETNASIVIFDMFGIDTWINIVEGFLSIILTVSLVYLYFRQTSILEDQKQLMKTEYSPEIDVNTIDPTTGSKVSNSANSLEIGIINSGEGTAFSPGICTEIDNNDLEKYKGICVNMKPSKSTDAFSGLSTDIPPNSGENLFYSGLSVKNKKSGEILDVCDFLANVYLQDKDEIEMTISVGVYNQLGERKETQILNLLIDLDELYRVDHTESESRKKEDLPEIDFAEVLFNGLSNRWDTVVPNEGKEYFVTENTTSDKTDVMVERAIRSSVEELRK